MNAFEDPDEQPHGDPPRRPGLEGRQIARLAEVRRAATRREVERTLGALRAAAEGDDNLMQPLLDCARAYASVGEMCDVLRGVFGLYRETPFF